MNDLLIMNWIGIGLVMNAVKQEDLLFAVQSKKIAAMLSNVKEDGLKIVQKELLWVIRISIVEPVMMSALLNLVWRFAQMESEKNPLAADQKTVKELFPMIARQELKLTLEIALRKASQINSSRNSKKLFLDSKDLS